MVSVSDDLKKADMVLDHDDQDLQRRLPHPKTCRTPASLGGAGIHGRGWRLNGGWRSRHRRSVRKLVVFCALVAANKLRG
jgi:hypothetical protein